MSDPMDALDPGLEQAIDVFARLDRVLLALDFDGTLAPIVQDPASARPLPPAVEAIQALVALPRTHVAVISGRSLEHLRLLVEPITGVALVGSHGAEIDEADLPGEGDAPAKARDDDHLLDDAAVQLLGRVRDAVADIVAGHDGTFLEEKPAAVVLHTRRADRDQAIRATGDALEGPGGWQGVHALRGKEVVELAVTDMTKGGALCRLRADLGLGEGGVLFAGDDTTDEQAFAVLDDDGGDVTVKVGDGLTGARHRVAGPESLAALLALVAQRRRPERRSQRA